MQSNFFSRGIPIRLHQTEPAISTPHPAVILLHGAGGNTAFWLDRIAPFLAKSGLALYAPHYFDRTGIQRADPALLRDGIHVPQWLETVADTVAHIRTRPQIDPDRIALLGISLGAFLSLAHAATHPGIRAIVEISGGLVDPYAARATCTFPPTLIFHGDQDTVVPLINATHLASRLSGLNVQHEQHILRGEGHWFSPPAQLRILAVTAQFLTRKL